MHVTYLKNLIQIISFPLNVHKEESYLIIFIIMHEYINK